jgi:3-hydroxy-9,10-secoandrosta-1,3,5(10)-triene-9,17-dione monooxygenase reductase component
VEQDPVVEPTEFRRVLGHFPTGVTVVTASTSDGPQGVAIGSFASISLEPPLVGFFIGHNSTSWPAMADSGSFCVNVLCHDQLELCGTMASKADDKFSGIMWEPAPVSGSPVLPDVHGFIDCRLEQVVDTGDHALIIGRVVHLETRREIEPLVFYRGQYGTFTASA